MNSALLEGRQMVMGGVPNCSVSLILKIPLKQHIHIIMLPDQRIKFLTDFPAAKKGCDFRQKCMQCTLKKCKFQEQKQIKQKSLLPRK